MMERIDITRFGDGAGFEEAPMEDVLQEWAVSGGLELEPLLHVVSLC